jgi:hypothetical protein
MAPTSTCAKNELRSGRADLNPTVLLNTTQ